MSDEEAAAPPGLTASGDAPYYRTPAPSLDAHTRESDATSAQTGAGSTDTTNRPDTTAGADIPATVLAAYKTGQSTLAKSQPGCHLPWQLLAAIGKIESGHARGGRVDAHGTARPPILGPELNGNGFAAIADTDNGAYDGDVRYDRAVGPMQFIPSTWSGWRTDGNNDGTADPNNVYDAAVAAGDYLCANGRDLANRQSIDQAILSYNNSAQYLATVFSWFVYYEHGYRVVPDGSEPPLPPLSSSSPTPAKAPQPTTAGRGPSSRLPHAARSASAPSSKPTGSGSSSASAPKSSSSAPNPPSHAPKPSPTAPPATSPPAKPSPTPTSSHSPSPSPSPSPSDSGSAASSTDSTPTG